MKCIELIVIILTYDIILGIYNYYIIIFYIIYVKYVQTSK